MIKSGIDSEYRSLHIWVERRLGKPMICDNCGDPSRLKYNWANISCEYLRDLSDWVRLCITCHNLIDGNRGRDRYDKSNYCRHGHLRSPENTWIRRTEGNQRRCLICKRLGQKKWRNKVKEYAI